MPRRWVYCFQPRFAELVASGAKRQTIRGERKDGLSPAPGDVLSLRAWVGLPYRSKQRLLRSEEVCVAVGTVEIGENFAKMDTPFDKEWYEQSMKNPAGGCEFEYLARADGFASFEEMRAWFREQHGLPFRGVLIRW